MVGTDVISRNTIVIGAAITVRATTQPSGATTRGLTLRTLRRFVRTTPAPAADRPKSEQHWKAGSVHCRHCGLRSASSLAFALGLAPKAAGGLLLLLALFRSEPPLLAVHRRAGAAALLLLRHRLADRLWALRARACGAGAGERRPEVRARGGTRASPLRWRT